MLENRARMPVMRSSPCPMGLDLKHHGTLTDRMNALAAEGYFDAGKCDGSHGGGGVGSSLEHVTG